MLAFCCMMHLRFILIICLLVSSRLQAQVPTGLADLHNSALHRLFLKQDVKGLEKDSFPVSIRAIRRLNTRLVVFSIGIPRFSMQHPDTVKISQVIQFLKDFKIQIQKHYPDFEQLENREVIKKGHKVYWMYALEGTHLLKGQLHWLDSLHKIGVRMIGLGHWFHNHFIVNPADLNYKNRVPEMINDQSVLSERGTKFLEGMIAKNMWIDVSHLRKRVFAQVVQLNANRTPLIASHANAHAVCPVARNLTDTQLKSIAKSRGLVGVCLHSPLISKPANQATIGKLVNHIVYLVKTIGYQHVAIGTDLEGRIRPPKNLSKLAHLQKIKLEMQRRGFSQNVIEAVMWKNAWRVLGAR